MRAICAWPVLVLRCSARLIERTTIKWRHRNTSERADSTTLNIAAEWP